MLLKSDASPLLLQPEEMGIWQFWVSIISIMAQKTEPVSFQTNKHFHTKKTALKTNKHKHFYMIYCIFIKKKQTFKSF